MASGITVDLKLSFREEDADGSKCIHCGDEIYLSPAYKPVLTITVGSGNPQAHEGDGLLCASCREVLK